MNPRRYELSDFRVVDHPAAAAEGPVPCGTSLVHVGTRSTKLRLDGPGTVNTDGRSGAERSPWSANVNEMAITLSSASPQADNRCS
jgi:hypothetical protein